MVQRTLVRASSAAGLSFLLSMVRVQFPKPGRSHRLFVPSLGKKQPRFFQGLENPRGAHPQVRTRSWFLGVLGPFGAEPETAVV